LERFRGTKKEDERGSLGIQNPRWVKPVNGFFFSVSDLFVLRLPVDCPGELTSGWHYLRENKTSSLSVACTGNPACAAKR
jgi:hypothetical protein